MNVKLRLISCILTILMVISLASCNSNVEIPTEAPTQAPTEAPTSAPTKKPTDKPTEAPTETDPPQVFSGEIKNIILIIGDGMGPEHIEAGQIFENTTYGFTKWNGSYCNTDSLHSNGSVGKLTDSAASATALATGNLTFNGHLGIDADGKVLNTIMDFAKNADKSVGVVTTDYLYGATPSGFSAHSKDRNDSDTITRTQATSEVDFLCGLNSSFYSAEHVELLEKNDYYYSNDLTDKDTIMSSEKVFLPVNIENGKSDAAELKDVAELAIEYLDRDEDGFVLMIEQAHIDKYSHSNDIEGMLKRVESLNDTVEAVMEWMGERTDTAVIVTADHETGGLTDDFTYTSGGHTGVNVPVFAYGYGSEIFNGEEMENTQIPITLADMMGVDNFGDLVYTSLLDL